jgi:chromosome segregation ATPase
MEPEIRLMIVSLRAVCLAVVLGLGFPAFAEFTTVPMPSPQDYIQQRQQLLKSIESEIDYLNRFLSDQAAAVAYASDFISRNSSNTERALLNIRTVERDIGRAIYDRDQTALAYNEFCARYWQQGFYCQKPESVRLINRVRMLENFIASAHQIRGRMIQNSNALFNSFSLAQADIQRASIAIGQLRVRRQSLERAISDLKKLPSEPVGFNFGNSDAEPRPSSSLPVAVEKKKTELEVQSAKTLERFDSVMTEAQSASAKVEAVLKSTRGTLDNVKKTLRGTPADQLDFGDF